MDDPMELNKLFLEHCPKAANKIEVFIESVRTTIGKMTLYMISLKARVISSASQQQQPQLKEGKGTILIRPGSD